MGYIINPMWFYWIQVVDTLKWVCIGLLVVIGIAAIFAPLVIDTFCYNDVDKTIKRMYKICAFAAAIVTLCVVFIPDRGTLISMMVAKFATYDNAQLTVEAIKSAVDYIVQAIQSIG